MRQCRETNFTDGDVCPRCHKPTPARRPFQSWRATRKEAPNWAFGTVKPERGWTAASRRKRDAAALARSVASAAEPSSAPRVAAGARRNDVSEGAITRRSAYRRKGPEPAPLLPALE